MAYGSDSSCAGGAVASNICDVLTHCYHRKALGVAGYAVANGFSLGTIFFSSEKEAYKVSAGSRDWAYGGRGHI